VDHVLLSHVHRDHVKGTQAFKEAVVVSTRWTAETMAKRWKERTEMVKRDGLDQIRTGVNGEFDAWESNELTDVADRVLWEGYRQAILQGLADYDLKLPSVGFEGSLVFQGAKKTAEAISFGGGHTESDALLYLPVERVAFLGDLLFTKCQPYIGDSNSKELLRVLDKVEALDCKVLVPGHGPVGTNRDIGLTREYIFALEKVVREKGRAEALKTKAPPPFDTWNLKAFWRENLESMMSSGPQT